jgi:hypothetical protein
VLCSFLIGYIDEDLIKTERKTVKFEKYLEPDISSTNGRGKHDFKELRDFIQGKSLNRSRIAAHPITAKESHKNTRVRTILSKKITKNTQECKRFDKNSRKSDFSRPSSVTSLFTSCSVGNNMYSQKFETFNEVVSFRDESVRNKQFTKLSDTATQNHIKSESQILKNDLERELVECIEDNLFISKQRTSERVKLRSRSRPKDVSMQNISIIREIQSDLERSQDMSVDEISLTSSSPQLREST